MTDRVEARVSGRRRLVTTAAWAVVGVVMVALAVVAVVRLVAGPDDPDRATSVEDVAQLTRTATEDLDVAGGVALLCDPPMDLYRMTVESTIVRWQAATGVGVPEVRAEVSEVPDGETGSFVVEIESTEEELAGEDHDFRVFVESRGGRSCVTGVGDVDAARPTTRFSAGGYQRVTSPPPTPGSSSSPATPRPSGP